MIREHVLKSEVDYFSDLWLHRRQFEIRRNDRSFGVGDRLRFKEYDRVNGNYTGREVARRVSFVLYADDRLGLMPGYCGLGLADDAA